MTISRRQSKYQRIYDFVSQQIERNILQPGQQLPTDFEYCERFNTSRPTVARALQMLEKEGLVERHVGRGTFVRRGAGISERRFGLLIPGLGQTEIFEPICAQMADLAETENFNLLWGSAGAMAGDRTEGALQLCQRYIQQQVDGVFFAPIELDPAADDANRVIIKQLKNARIPVVLLDREPGEFPECSNCDLIGLDNFRTGYLLAEHLLGLGCERVDFLARPGSAQTIPQRIGGYREALRARGIEAPVDWVHIGDPDRREFVTKAIEGEAHAIICANDDTAGAFMATLDGLGYSIPEQIRVVGCDDAKYARMLRVPLTTLHQPCEQFGVLAIHTMLERLARPKLPPRKILLEGKLIVRRSCGSEEM